MQSEQKTAETIAQDLGCTIEQHIATREAFTKFLEDREGRDTDTLELIRYAQSLDIPEACKLYLIHKLTSWLHESNSDPIARVFAAALSRR